MEAGRNRWMNGGNWLKTGVEWVWRGGFLTQFNPIVNPVVKLGKWVYGWLSG
jgi:hypothetical protein